MTSVSSLPSEIQTGSSGPGPHLFLLVITRDSEGSLGMMPCVRRGSIKTEGKKSKTGALGPEIEPCRLKNVSTKKISQRHHCVAYKMHS